MDSKMVMWAVAIKNMVCMICWTHLAITFDKWWVALFAVLTMTEVKWSPTGEKQKEEETE